MPTDELRAELDRALRLTVEHLNHLAAVWAELERRGEDLSQLRKGVGRYVASIARGELLAEVVVAFAEDANALRRVAALPTGEQAEVVAGRRPPPAKRRWRRSDAGSGGGSTLPSLLDMAKAGSAQDVADLCLQMVQAHESPADVARRLIPELERIVQQSAKRRMAI